MSFAAIGVMIHFWMTTETSLWGFSTSVYVYGLLMAVLSTVIPSYLVVQGIKRIGSENAAIVGSIGPVSTLLMAYFLLDESVSSLQILGTAFILLGVLLVSKQKTAQAPAG